MPNAMCRRRLLAMVSLAFIAGSGCGRSTAGSNPAQSGSKNGERSTDSAARGSRTLLRSEPPGLPGPGVVCGHAVAFAGWRSGSLEDAVLICDPADNALVSPSGIDAHIWKPRPLELAVHYGQRRPSIVLMPASPYTVTGAVVILPRDSAPLVSRKSARANNIADVTQFIGADGTGFCGPASAVDVLFSMGGNREAVLGGRTRGPVPVSDRGVLTMIVGDGEKGVRGLAARMNVGTHGLGATNEGIRAGITDWLDQHDPARWTVRLDWFDDDEKPAALQRDFFGRLAAASEAGGGAVLCLWPGTEFSDGAVADGLDDLAAAGGSGCHTTPPKDDQTGTVVFPGREAPRGSARASASSATARLDAVRRRLQSGDAAAAFEDVSEVISSLRLAAAHDAAARQQLATAMELAAVIESRLPSTAGVEGGKPTVFQ